VQQSCGVLQSTLQQHSARQQQQQHAESEGAAVAACKVLQAVRLLLQDSATTAAAASAVPEQRLKAGKAALAQLVTGAVVPEVGRVCCCGCCQLHL
jgi:hypothetical protein